MIGCVTNCQISCDHWNSELKVRYSSHGLNNEQAKVSNSNVSVIRMFAIQIPTVTGIDKPVCSERQQTNF